jgi:hypothetical protein
MWECETVRSEICAGPPRFCATYKTKQFQNQGTLKKKIRNLYFLKISQFFFVEIKVRRDEVSEEYCWAITWAEAAVILWPMGCGVLAFVFKPNSYVYTYSWPLCTQFPLGPGPSRRQILRKSAKECLYLRYFRCSEGRCQKWMTMINRLRVLRQSAAG